MPQRYISILPHDVSTFLTQVHSAQCQLSLHQRPWSGQLGHCGGSDGYRGGQSIGKKEIRTTLTVIQEFSIEIPDKEADAIHSGRSWERTWGVLKPC